MDRINTLFEKYKNNRCSSEEIEELLEYFKIGDDEVLLKKYIEVALDQDAAHHAELEKDTDEIYSRLQAHILNEKSSIRRLNPTRWIAAASVILMVALGGYFLLRKPNVNPLVNIKPGKLKNDIAPGSNKAILTLGNGKQIILTGATNGVLANQGGTKIVKRSNGELLYNAQNSAIQPDTRITYNTITIPRGGQYQVILPDGSKVLLNSASSLSYPTVFAGKNRKVELKGEAYFEVAKNKEKPFIVKANNIEVRVLGTHFNISAYADDASIITTLLEGSVRMDKGAATTLLSPGQQGIAMNNGDDVYVQKADLEEVMAWRNGFFVFNDLNIKDVMKIAARWYDIDVEYHGNVQYKKFGGTTSRYKNITELLDNMNITGGIHYKIEGRRVILMN